MINARSVICHSLAAAISLSFAVFLGMLFDRRPVVDLDATKSFISPAPARPGERIFITWSAVAHRNCAGYTIPRVVESTGRVFEYARTPTVYQDLMAPLARSFTKELILPAIMTSGPARYEAIVIRWCNPVQQYIWPMIDRPFPIYFEIAP